MNSDIALIPPIVVCEGLYRGPFPDDELLDVLAQLNVRTIVTLCDEHFAAQQIGRECKTRQLKNVHIPLNAFVCPSEKQISRFLEALESRHESGIYVHCIHGRDRTGTMIGIFRLSQGWSYDEVLSEMQKHGFGMEFRRLLDAVSKYASIRPTQLR